MNMTLPEHTTIRAVILNSVLVGNHRNIPSTWKRIPVTDIGFDAALGGLAIGQDIVTDNLKIWPWVRLGDFSV